jgi:hypothetical protein
MQGAETTLAIIGQDIKWIKEKLKEVADNQEKNYATKDQLALVAQRVTGVEDTANKSAESIAWVVRLVIGTIITTIIGGIYLIK